MRVFRSRLWYVLLPLLILPPLLLSLALAAIKTETGRDWLAAQINKSGVVQIRTLEGSPWGTLTLSGLVIETESLRIEADRVDMHLRPYALLARRLHVRSLDIGRMVFTPKPTAASPAPQDLSLPFPLLLDRVSARQLDVPGRVLANVRLRFSSNGRRHLLESLYFESQWGRVNGDAVLDAHAPFMLGANIAYEGEFEGRPVKAAGRAVGGLRDLKLDFEARSGGVVSAHVDARLDLFAEHAYRMMRAGRVHLRDFDPARISAQWPHGRFDLALDVLPTGPETASGHLSLRNAAPGALDQHRLPVSVLETRLAYRGDTILFDGLNLNVPGGGVIAGKGAIRMGMMDLDLAVRALDPSRLLARQPPAALTGQLVLKGPWLSPDIRTDIHDAQRDAGLRADLGWSGPPQARQLVIREAQLSRGGQRIALQGEVGIHGNRTFTLQGELAGFNPAQWLDAPAGQISGHFETSGDFSRQMRAHVRFHLAESRFNGEALGGEGQLDLDQTHLSGADFWLALGRNRIQARGALGREGDNLLLELDCADLRSVGSGFAGQARGALTLSGRYNQPLVSGDILLDGLRTPWGIAAAHADVSARIAQGENAPLNLDVNAGGLEYDGHKLTRLQLELSGIWRAHRLHVLASEEKYALEAVLTGGWQDQRWHGELEKLVLDGPQKVVLREKAGLAFSASELTLSSLQLQAPQGEIRLDALSWIAGRLSSRGEFTHLALDPWLRLLAPDMGSDLVLAGRWDVTLGEALDGSAALWRESGESVWRGQATRRFSPQISGLKLEATARQNRIALQGELASLRYGSARFSGESEINPHTGRLRAQAPVNFLAQGRIPDLSAFNAMTGPDFLLAGALDFDLSHQGDPVNGRFSGEINGQSLAIKDPATGLDLFDGRLRLQLADHQVELREAFFRGGKGTVSGSGRLDLDGGSAQADVHFNRLRIFGRPDLLLVLSGDTGLRMKNGQIDLNGKLKADEGDLRYRSVDVPRLSDDVRIAGARKEEAQRLPKVALQFDVDLGEMFRFRGFGVDAFLNGLLRLRAEPARPLSAQGVVQVGNGIYRAYGRKLDIEQGVLSFQGPVDNPGIDILAMRRNMTVAAGVTVQGTARNPRVQLYSEPTVPDTEKLSWLLFGHDSSNMERSDSTLLLQGVSALLSDDDGGPSLSERMLDTVGIEEVDLKTVKSSDGKQTQVMTVTKRLLPNLQFALEKSFNGLSDAVKLTYQLSQRWSLITRWGTDENSLEASYTFRFDGPKHK